MKYSSSLVMPVFFSLLLFPLFYPAHSSIPEFSHSAGTYTQPFDLYITSGSENTIYYTTNGDVPDETSAYFYEGASIQINGTKIIRARTYNENSEAGEIVTKVFTQLAPDVADFTSNLPLVVHHQFGDIMHPNGDYRTPAYFTVFDKEEDGRARLLSNQPHVHSHTMVNYRGSSSLSFPKKQFAVRLVDDYGENRNEALLGMPSENNWIMHAPYDDRTLIRNAVAYQISRDMGRYAPRTRFVELFLHYGNGPVTKAHYHGVYMLVERIKWDNNRVNIEKIEADDQSEPEISGGYIINHEFGRESHIASTHRNTRFALVRPQDHNITHQQRSWIENYLGDLERALFGSGFRDPDLGYRAYLEPESFIDHHLITETFKEMDGYRASTFLHKDRGGRLIMGPVWDYNLSLGNYTTTEGWNGHSPTGWYYTHVPEEWYINGWYNRLFQDSDFSDRYHERWWELRNGPFSTEHFLHVIHSYVEKLDEAKNRNFERWPILGEDVWRWSREGFSTYAEEIDYMSEWISDRLAWIDTQMDEPTNAPETDQLLYFWVFDDSMDNNTPFTTLEANYALSNRSTIYFQSALDGYPFHEDHNLWRKASMERRNRPTEINYQPMGNLSRPYDSNRIRALQVRQPFYDNGMENTLLFEVPTSGIEDHILFHFAAKDEGAADELLIDYSTDSEQNMWSTAGLQYSQLSLSHEYQKYSINFSEAESVSDNENFTIRIRFSGPDMAADDGNRVTFNNFSIQTTTESVPTSADPHHGETANLFEINHVYPNPFNPQTTIVYTIPESQHIKLSVFNLIGREVSVLVDDQMASGRYSIQFDGSHLSSGVYFLHLQSGMHSTIKPLTLIK